jgi:hypothetical protein
MLMRLGHRGLRSARNDDPENEGVACRQRQGHKCIHWPKGPTSKVSVSMAVHGSLLSSDGGAAPRSPRERNGEGARAAEPTGRASRTLVVHAGAGRQRGGARRRSTCGDYRIRKRPHRFKWGFNSKINFAAQQFRMVRTSLIRISGRRPRRLFAPLLKLPTPFLNRFADRRPSGLVAGAPAMTHVAHLGMWP